MVLYLVVPCYNEEDVLPISSAKLLEKMNSLISAKRISEDSRIVFVDDGSKDKTWQLIQSYHNQNPIFSGVKLTRNRGHQNALLAGLMTVKGDCDAAISLDADLQDDINAIDLMLDEYEKGCEIVCGVRSDRKSDTFFKRKTATAYYTMMKKMGVDILYNHADFRLMSQKALCAFENFDEVNIFLRGMVPLIGFKTGTVEYERGVRLAGESKYPLKAMLKLAVEGITSLSIKPIRIITSLGILIFVLSIIALIYSVVSYFAGATVPGWTSTVISIWAVGGLQMLAVGVIGEYIGKIYLETKHRPKFIIEEYLENQKNAD